MSSAPKTIRDVTYKLEQLKVSHKKKDKVLEVGNKGWESLPVIERRDILNVCGREHISIQLFIE